MPLNPLLGKLDLAAESAMREMIGGAVRTQAIYTIAVLGVADRLALGARSADELAKATGTHPPTLRRLLRYLVTRSVFIEEEDGRFALAPAGEYLQSGHPRSLRPSAIRAGEGLWQTAAALCEAVRSGTTPHDRVHGERYFDRLRGKEAQFAARMSGSTAGLAAAIAAHPSLESAATLVDAGGGNGWLLMQILERRDKLRGIVLDREATIAAAREMVEKSAAAPRIELIAGDFFLRIPAGDIILLSWVLHDWDDAGARRILQACRAAGAPTLLIVELLLPHRARPIDESIPGMITDPFTLDLQMLLLTGGKERTLEEYGSLLSEGGYDLVSASPLPSERGASLLTARLESGVDAAVDTNPGEGALGDLGA